MLSYVFNKYFSNFSKLIPYLLAQVIFNVILARLFLGTVPIQNGIKFNFGGGGTNFTVNNGSLGALGGSAILLLIITIVTGPLFAVFVRLVTRNILDDREINQGEIFLESFSYYWRYVGIVLLMFLIALAIFLGMMFLRFIPLLGILGIIALVIFVIYLFTILTPCMEYMVYDNLTVEEAFSSGKEVGKENFWSIFFFTLVLGIISGLFKTDNSRSLLIISLIVFIKQSIEAFKAMYIMVLCKQHKEQKYGFHDSEY